MEISSRFKNYLLDWDYTYYLLVGGYGSGKSYHTALKLVLKALEEKRTILVARAVFVTLKDSCFSLFKDILDKLGLLADEGASTKERRGKVIAVSSPMEIRFPNGSRIIFRGLDNFERIKSIHGVSIVWVEECTEIKYEAFMELLGRIREPGVTLHFILTCNPVGTENWVYNMYFVHTEQDGKETTIVSPEQFYKRKTFIKNGVYYHHSTLDDNPFLPTEYKNRIDGIKVYDKPLWLVSRWGHFGVNGLRVLPNFRVASDSKAFVNKVRNISASNHYFGLDFGFEESFNALISCCVDTEHNDLYIYNEVYVNHITDDRFANRVDVRRVAEQAARLNKPIVADAAEPKSIQFYRQNGFNMKACKKYIGSRLQNTKKMKRFRRIICSPKCKNTIRELSNLTYAKDSQGNAIYDEFNIDSHSFSALWYSLDTYTVPDYKVVTNSRKSIEFTA